MVLLAKSLLTALMLTASSNSSFASDADIDVYIGSFPYPQVAVDKNQAIGSGDDSLSGESETKENPSRAAINTVKNTTIIQAMRRFMDQYQPSLRGSSGYE